MKLRLVKNLFMIIAKSNVYNDGTDWLF